MKFVIKSQIREVVLPPNTLISSETQMNEEESGHHSVAPKRTINESGTIVLSTGDEGGEPTPLMVENPLGEEQEESPTKKRRVLSFRPKRFRSEWLVYDMFKHWLRPHPNPERAMCTVCNIVLNAGKSELEKHAAAKKHQRKMSEMRKPTYIENEPSLLGVMIEGQEVEAPLNSPTYLQRHDSTEGAVYSTAETSYTEQTMEQSTNSATSHSAFQPRKPADTCYMSKAMVSKPAPPWKATAIVNGHVTRLELADYKGRYVILFFYPQDFSAVCPTEILALSDRVSEFRGIQTEIVACSVDSHLTHLAWARTPRADGGLANPKIPLLADPTHTIARDYGVLLPEAGHTLRAHFIIDRRGVLRHMAVNDTYVGRSIDELLRMTQAIQQVDETETGCPADWKPGLPTV